MKKTVYISETNLERLEKIKEKYGFSSESQVINYLIAREDEEPEKRVAEAVRKELEENYLQKDRIKWATQVAEQNTIILLDAVNTLLHREKIDHCISVNFSASPVIQESQEKLKERIKYFKQKSDDRKSRGKTYKGSKLTP